ncbi:hypothetical protein ABMA28_010218 [Loxostege sticticalis]|uniref:Gustatory receptor n=1 Tax=Loxostege sticticalis TaxID=481309 RepID=A0ABD0SA39_LOXSC
MQKKPDDAFETFASVNWLFKIFGLSILRRENNVLKARYSWVQIIFVVTFVIVLLALAIYDIINACSNEGFAKRKSKFSVFVRLTWIASFINYIVGLSYIFRFGQNITLNYFKMYAQIDKIIGITYTKIVKAKIIKTSVLIISIGYVIFIILFFAEPAGVFSKMSFTIKSTTYILSNLNVIEMSANIIQIEYRIKAMRDILLDLFHSFNNNKAKVIDVVCEKNWLYFSKDRETARRELSPSKILVYYHFSDLIWLNKCYSLLIEQASFINCAYGIRILINNTLHLLFVIQAINGTVRYFHLTFNKLPLMNLIATILITVNSAVFVVCLVYRCEKTYKQRNAIISIVDHILVDKEIDESTRSTLAEFRTLVHTRPIEFTAANFYRLDYGLLGAFSSVIITYTVILLQNL